MDVKFILLVNDILVSATDNFLDSDRLAGVIRVVSSIGGLIDGCVKCGGFGERIRGFLWVDIGIGKLLESLAEVLVLGQKVVPG